MNIVVLGPGAIGSLWAFHLNQAGHQVSLWHRSPAAKRSIQLDNHPAIELINGNISRLKQADLLLVTVKAWQVHAALIPIKPLLNPDTIILLMHNGMGAEQVVAEDFPHNPVVMATTSHAAYRVTPSHIKHTGCGETHLGGINDKGRQCDFLAAVMDNALAKAEWSDDIHLAQWQKLAVNCVINPLTASLQCHNGDLLEEEPQNQIQTLITEIKQVMQAEGINVTESALLKRINTIINATADNYSSMEQDIINHRKTEIDFINGYLIKRAQAHGIATPANLALYRTIKTIEPNGKRK